VPGCGRSPSRGGPSSVARRSTPGPRTGSAAQRVRTARADDRRARPGSICGNSSAAARTAPGSRRWRGRLSAWWSSSTSHTRHTHDTHTTHARLPP
jgi:hypothetical protein